MLRFIGESARDALVMRCGDTMCGAASILSLPGILLTVVIAGSLAVLFTVELVLREPAGVLGKLKGYPSAAPLMAWMTTNLIAVASLYLNTRQAKYLPPDLLIDVSYATSIFLVALFALMFGRVVAPRAQINVKYLDSWQVRTGLYLAAIISAAGMLGIGGSKYYLAFWVLGPALAVFGVIVRSRRNRGRHASSRDSRQAVDGNEHIPLQRQMPDVTQTGITPERLGR